MQLPPFTEVGALPPGEHETTFAQVVEKLAWNEHRAGLVAKLGEALVMLSLAGCRTVWLNGSFVTAKDFPDDVDVLYDARGVRPKALDPAFADKDQKRKKYGGDYRPVDGDGHSPTSPKGLFEYFMSDRDGVPKGIVRIVLPLGKS